MGSSSFELIPWAHFCLSTLDTLRNRFKCIDLDGNGEVIVLHSWKPDAVIAEEEQDWNVLSVKERSGVDGDDEFSNSTLVAHTATGRNGIANGSTTIDVMIDTQNDSSANGFIVRDGNICPVKIKSFKEISPMDQDHMWAVVQDSFKNDNFELHRKYVFHHMKKLWDNWRGSRSEYIKKKCGNDKALALERGHKDFEQEDWAWLIENHFFTDKFLGGKDGNPPTLETIYFETRKTKNKTLEEAAARKYDQITEVRRSQPSISTIDLIETCFKPQKGHVICFGGAVKPKDLRSSQPSRAELMTKFQQQRDEDATTFTNRIDEQQKYINELHVDHQRAMDELKDDHRREMNTIQAEMRMLKQLVLQGHGYSTSLPIDS
ncbi:hypothetical protein Dimus_008072 [Dionaea muscipula]